MSLLITIALWWLAIGSLTWMAVYLGTPKPFSLGLVIASAMVVLFWPLFLVAFIAGGGRT